MGGTGETTRKILRALEGDARRNAAQVATMVGAPEAEVAAEIARLERNGTIRGYRTTIAWDRVLGDRVVAFIDVSVSPQRDVGFDQVAARLYRHSAVRRVHLVSGGHDLRCTVTGRSIRAVSDFVSQKLSTIDRVTSTATHFVLKTYKRDGDAFTAQEADHRLPVTP